MYNRYISTNRNPMRKIKVNPTLTPEQVEYLEDIIWDYQSEKKDNPKFKPNIYIERLIKSFKD